MSCQYCHGDLYCDNTHCSAIKGDLHLRSVLTLCKIGPLLFLTSQGLNLGQQIYKTAGLMVALIFYGIRVDFTRPESKWVEILGQIKKITSWSSPPASFFGAASFFLLFTIFQFLKKKEKKEVFFPVIIFNPSFQKDWPRSFSRI